MRALIQRVSKASVIIDGITKSTTSAGMVILLGIENRDEEEDVEWLAGKISRLRIFDDENGVMNHSVTDVNGEIIVVSQFTLHASTKKGNRPSYIKAARPEKAIPLYNAFVDEIEKLTGKRPGTGEFGATMEVQLNNDGPVTIMIDSQNKE